MPSCPSPQPGAAPAFSFSLGLPPSNSTNSILQNSLNAPALILGNQSALASEIEVCRTPRDHCVPSTLSLCSPTNLRTNDRHMHIHTHTCKYVRIRIHVCMYVHEYHCDLWKKAEDPSPDLASLPPQSTPSIWLWQRVKIKHVCTKKTGHLIPLPCIDQLDSHPWDLDTPKTCHSNSYGPKH